MAKKRRFEMRNYQSNKFWQTWVEGSTFYAEWGPLDGDPRSQKKAFSSSWSAENHKDKKIREKENKGYIEVRTITFETDAERLRRMRDEAVKKELEKVGIKQSADEIKALLKQAKVTPSVGLPKNAPVDTRADKDKIEIVERFQMLEFDD